MMAAETLNGSTARGYQVWFSSFCCNLVFFSIGIIGCMAFAPYLAGVASNNVRS